MAVNNSLLVACLFLSLPCLPFSHRSTPHCLSGAVEWDTAWASALGFQWRKVWGAALVFVLLRPCNLHPLSSPALVCCSFLFFFIFSCFLTPLLIFIVHTNCLHQSNLQILVWNILNEGGFFWQGTLFSFSSSAPDLSVSSLNLASEKKGLRLIGGGCPRPWVSHGAMCSCVGTAVLLK